jgi:hypothetical protein
MFLVIVGVGALIGVAMSAGCALVCGRDGAAARQVPHPWLRDRWPSRRLASP